MALRALDECVSVGRSLSVIMTGNLDHRLQAQAGPSVPTEAVETYALASDEAPPPNWYRPPAMAAMTPPSMRRSAPVRKGAPIMNAAASPISSGVPTRLAGEASIMAR